MQCSDLHLVNKIMQVWFQWIVYSPDFKQLTENTNIDYLVYSHFSLFCMLKLCFTQQSSEESLYIW